jgi:hypothetical protein
VTWRRATDLELRYLAKLLEEPFPGRDELVAQLPALEVEPCCSCGCGSLALRPGGGPRAPISTGPPVNANTADRDGTPIEVRLHVRDGLMHELEIYRGRGRGRRSASAGSVGAVPALAIVVDDMTAAFTRNRGGGARSGSSRRAPIAGLRSRRRSPTTAGEASPSAGGLRNGRS